MFSLPSFDQILAGFVLFAVLFLVCKPILWAFDPLAASRLLRSGSTWLYLALIYLVGGFVSGWLLEIWGDPGRIQEYGRIYASIVHALLILDLMILLPRFLILIWPRGGAVALAAYREGYRQPLFWTIGLIAALFIGLSTIVPYFTFGDDYKMMKHLGFDICMLAAGLFGVLAASISIFEEIEGRTAITVISKPVTRRQFLLGKFFGLAMAAGAMTLILGWVLNWALFIQPSFNPLDEVNDPMPIQATETLQTAFESVLPGDAGRAAAQGVAAWSGDTLANSLGLLLGYGQVLILVALASALATRMPMVANLAICLVLFIMGNLSPVLVEFTVGLRDEQGTLATQLVAFLAQFFDAVLPSLERFQMGPAVVRDSAIDLWEFAGYVLRVFGYSVIYTAIVMLAGLILFEDRDLA